VARYEFLIALRNQIALEQRLKSAELDLESAERDLLDREARARVAIGAVEVAREALRAASIGDRTQVLDQLRQREAELKHAEGQVAIERRNVVAAEALAQERAGAFELAVSRRDELRAECVAELDGAAREARSLTHPLSATLQFAERMVRERGVAAASPEFERLDPGAAGEIELLIAHCSKELTRAEGQLTLRRAELELRSNEVSVLESASELPASITGLPQARMALAAAGLPARPLYELLEPSGDATDAELTVLEELIGEPALASLVVTREHLDAARALALPYEGVRVVVRSARDAAPPRWVTDLLRASPEALGIVGTLLSQAPSLGPLEAADALGDVEHRGVVQRTLGGTPRLIGLAARRRARETRLKEARQMLAEGERAVTAAESVRERTLCDRRAALRVEHALSTLRGSELTAAEARVAAARLLATEAEQRTRECAGRLETADERRLEVAALVAVLGARIKDEGLEELAARLEQLKRAESQAVTREREAREQQAAASVRVRGSKDEIQKATEELGQRGAALGERREKLREALALLRREETRLPDGELDRWVRVAMRGDQFSRLENIEERRREVDRKESALCSEIEGDGSRGVKNLEWAGRFGFTWFSSELAVVDRRGEPVANVLAKVDADLTEQREVVNDRTRELMDRLVMGELARELQEQVERLHRTVHDINRLLGDLRFGSTRFRFKVTPHASAQEIVELVRKLSVLDETSRIRFRAFIDERLAELRRLDGDAEVPELLDYRRWFDYRLSMSSGGRGDTELTRELRALGSGGEQGVPNYLLVLALAKLMFDAASARVRPLLFDEAFYGIDAGRRDQLLRFATELGLQLVVASPDQDGVTPSASSTTTLFLLRDEHSDVHLAPYHYWNDSGVAQKSLFAERSEQPPPDEAICTTNLQNLRAARRF